MTDDEALAATEEFSRKVARRALACLRQAHDGGGVSKPSDPAGYFAAVHSGVAAAYALGVEVGAVGREARDGR